jgi:putative redox protein
LLVFHSPTDDTVGIDNASHIFMTAKHPKSFISLAGSDHLVSRASDAAYVASVISAWADRYLDMAVDAQPTDDTTEGRVIVRETRRGKFQQEVITGAHRLLADEPVKAGGLDSGPGPYDLLLAALGACTSMTVRLYADQKQIPLVRTQVRLRHAKIYATDCAECETKEGKIDHIDRVITFEGDLTAEQRVRLLEIADKCPVHRTLKSEVDIRTLEWPAG